MFSYQTPGQNYESCGMFQPIDASQEPQQSSSHRRNFSPHWKEVDRWQQYYPVVLPESLHISKLRSRSPNGGKTQVQNQAQKRSLECTYLQNKKFRLMGEETFDSMEVCAPEDEQGSSGEMKLDAYYNVKW